MFGHTPTPRMAIADHLGIHAPSFPSHLSSLDDILKRINRSNSWAYEKGLVPMFDVHGLKIENAKSPPWPWKILPDPIIKAGKKAWLTSDIDHWLARMTARANGIGNAGTNSLPNKEHRNV
ncbi:hypothetical protein DWU98_09460 [Dyella monticola]|uniref:Uncharacterized protein n=2 Tax=Dyella monticola TaxID=1927958 RepID=A0A370X1X3_9GAMM|nr:hypothetical protein DWU98_09460 [Dyella monticola]